MSIRIYNTLTRKKEDFESIEPGKVTMYVCGPTVYDSCHIGHARSAVVFDIIGRHLESRGYEVTYVRNFTDVDDKIIRRAQELNTDCTTVSEKYIQEFYEDMDALFVRRATIEPRATEHIDDILNIINILIEKNVAYAVGGDVYFSVEAFEGYGKLSGRRLEDMAAGARVEVDVRKKNPFDFALWKDAKPGEPSWESPWGKGRPGWHIECSGMSSRYLGETFDIHGGGKDLIFPHHENEIAQSEAAFGVQFVRYWAHNGFVNIDHEKMSKSLGNFLLIRDILKTYHPEAVRLFLLTSHYRSPVDFTRQAMEEAETALEKIYGAMVRMEEVVDTDAPRPKASRGDYWPRFQAAMDDDFNTAQGIGILFEMIRNVNRILDEAEGDLSDEKKGEIQAAYDVLSRMGRILGVLNTSTETYFSSKKQQGLEDASIDATWVEKMIQARADARKSKDWKRADEIRDELEKKNILLEDRPDGTIWKVG
jgi:cysteinyl-tRNA synthetase